MRIPDGSDQSADISREFFRAGDHLDLMADGRNIEDVELIYEAHHPDFFIFDAFQHLWLEDTTPHFRDEVDLFEPFDGKALFLEERSCSFPVNEGVCRNAASRHFSHPFQGACLLRFGIEALKRLPDHYVGGDPRATKDFQE